MPGFSMAVSLGLSVAACSHEGLLEHLPQLGPDEKTSLDCELTLEELTIAVNQMALGQAPGIDNLSTDF